MIYTIGRKISYEQYLNEDPNPLKMPGGTIWLHREDAENFIKDNPDFTDWGVYGVEADWETDTESVEGEEYHELVRPAKLVRLQE